MRDVQSNAVWTVKPQSGVHKLDATLVWLLLQDKQPAPVVR